MRGPCSDQVHTGRAAVAGLGVVLQVRPSDYSTAHAAKLICGQAYSTFQLPWQHRQTVRLSKVPRWLLLLLVRRSSMMGRR